VQINRVYIPTSIERKLERKHHIKRIEVKEVFFNDEVSPLIHRSYEKRYIAYGRTFAGRYLLYWFRFAFSHLRVLEELVTGYW